MHGSAHAKRLPEGLVQVGFLENDRGDNAQADEVLKRRFTPATPTFGPEPPLLIASPAADEHYCGDKTFESQHIRLKVGV